MPVVTVGIIIAGEGSAAALSSVTFLREDLLIAAHLSVRVIGLGATVVLISVIRVPPVNSRDNVGRPRAVNNFRYAVLLLVIVCMHSAAARSLVLFLRQFAFESICSIGEDVPHTAEFFVVVEALLSAAALIEGSLPSDVSLAAHVCHGVVLNLPAALRETLRLLDDRALLEIVAVAAELVRRVDGLFAAAGAVGSGPGEWGYFTGTADLLGSIVGLVHTALMVHRFSSHDLIIATDLCVRVVGPLGATAHLVGSLRRDYLTPAAHGILWIIHILHLGPSRGQDSHKILITTTYTAR